MRGVDLCENHRGRVRERGAMSIEEEEEEDGRIVSLCNSCIERIRGGLAILSVLKVRVVDLEYS